ncbi:MAG TPA: hypothetical protein HPQ04_09390 [Rhodospirillaceae bacterium]|nr:hypothetical protein [Rhodospirillaceae bacterium]
MVGLTLVGAVLAAIAYYSWVLPAGGKAARDEAAAEGVVAAMLVCQKAAVDWCLAGNCDSAGRDIAPDQLILPPGYSLPSWLHARGDGRRVWTFADEPTLDLGAVAAALGDLTFGGPSAGISRARAGLVELSARADVPAEPTFASGLSAGLPMVIQQVK